MSDSKAIRWQTAILPMVLALAAGSLGAAYWLVTHDAILLPSRLAEWKRSNGLYLDCRFYKSSEERLLNEILPHTDYSHGGVYLLGASNTLTAFDEWELPPREQALIHNYCLSAATFSHQFQFVRDLVEREGMLRAGGEKSAVLLGLFFGDGERRASLDPHSMFSGAFPPGGLYSYSIPEGFRAAPLSARERALRLEENRNRAFWTWAAALIFAEPLDYLRPPHQRSAAENRDYWLNRLGPGWQAGMDAEVAQLAAMIDYLRARGVAVHAVFAPMASWTDGFAPAMYYRERVIPLLASKGVPATDLSHAAVDTDFMDSVHLGYTGVRKTHPAILSIARQYEGRTL